MDETVKKICQMHGLKVKQVSAVSGGDINATFSVATSVDVYFVKINAAAKYPSMFEKEADGLKALQKASLLHVPNVHAVGEYNGQQYLLMDWLEKGKPSINFWQQLGEGIAQLHQLSNKQFGWHTSNYIGSLYQANDFREDWSTFYAEQRLLPLERMLFDRQDFNATDITLTERLCTKLKDIFPEEKPALIHGDLWAGNFMPVKNKEGSIVPSIYDAAVYFGHREMDMGMSLLFGGFDKQFYDAYNATFPLESNWRERISLTQLYPLLVHAILFGGGYIQQCKNILKDWN